MEDTHDPSFMDVFIGAEITPSRSHQRQFVFDNGFGASVVWHEFAYGTEAGMYEIAVLGQDGGLCYTTPITADVLGWQDEEDVISVLTEIAALPS